MASNDTNALIGWQRLIRKASINIHFMKHDMSSADVAAVVAEFQQVQTPSLIRR